jgi:hypothetical protein
MRSWIATASLIVDAGMVCVTIGVFWLLTDLGSALALGTWVCLPYMILAGFADRLRTHRFASEVMLAGTLLVASLGFWLFSTLELEIRARLFGGTMPMNCSGPILPLGLALVQIIIAGIVCMCGMLAAMRK